MAVSFNPNVAANQRSGKTEAGAVLASAKPSFLFARSNSTESGATVASNTGSASTGCSFSAIA